MLNAVLFDMDGVIVDTEPLHHKAYYQLFDSVGIDVSDELYQSCTGQSTINVCKKIKEHFGIKLPAKELAETKQANFKHLFANDNSLQLLDGVLELIQDYHKNGLTLILASSASHNTINNVFSRFDLDQYFKAKISGSDFEKSKPHPAIFLKAAELAKQPIENCMVIEDSTNGIQAAKAANIYCVGFKSPHSKNQDYSEANKVISTFSQINYNKIKYRTNKNFYFQ
ncbi:MAG: HAD-IA family hydrolase [Flavobacteriales bacterium]|nr:HAD-IA family hydrolase [Flavobacteriales bacterium]